MNSNEEIGYEKGRSSYQPRIRCKHRDGLLPSLRRVKMIDVITVQYTRFVNLSSDGDDESCTYGYRMYSDHDETYNNIFTSFDQLRRVVNRENIFAILEKEYPDFYDGSQAIEFNGEILYPEEEEDDE